jgi:hypothetical protein
MYNNMWCNEVFWENIAIFFLLNNTPNTPLWKQWKIGKQQLFLCFMIQVKWIMAKKEEVVKIT